MTTSVGGNAEFVASDDQEGMARALAEGLDRRWDRKNIRGPTLQHTSDRVAEHVFDAWTDAVRASTAIGSPAA